MLSRPSRAFENEVAMIDHVFSRLKPGKEPFRALIVGPYIPPEDWSPHEVGTRIASIRKQSGKPKVGGPDVIDLLDIQAHSASMTIHQKYEGVIAGAIKSNAITRAEGHQLRWLGPLHTLGITGEDAQNRLNGLLEKARETGIEGNAGEEALERAKQRIALFERLARLYRGATKLSYAQGAGEGDPLRHIGLWQREVKKEAAGAHGKDWYQKYASGALGVPVMRMRLGDVRKKSLRPVTYDFVLMRGTLHYSRMYESADTMESVVRRMIGAVREGGRVLIEFGSRNDLHQRANRVLMEAAIRRGASGHKVEAFRVGEGTGTTKEGLGNYRYRQAVLVTRRGGVPAEGLQGRLVRTFHAPASHDSNAFLNAIARRLAPLHTKFTFVSETKERREGIHHAELDAIIDGEHFASFKISSRQIPGSKRHEVCVSGDAKDAWLLEKLFPPRATRRKAHPLFGLAHVGTKGRWTRSGLPEEVRKIHGV